LGAKAFEQAAGFLRIQHGDVVLDCSAVHPESYPVVERIARSKDCDVSALLGNKSLLDSIDAHEFVSAEVGLVTVQDIIAELGKPGRDPRPQFEFVTFKEGVEKISDLVPDMVLEGNVTNVTNFGAFVDIGVHQDGLVHISALANSFVKDPRDVVRTGAIVKVKVMSVDLPRKRIALSMRLDDSAAEHEAGKGQKPRDDKPRQGAADASQKRSPRAATARSAARPPAAPQGALAMAFAHAKRKDSD
jgi:uncharacterized protein